MDAVIDKIEPFVKVDNEKADKIHLYHTQADMQLLSKLRSQSYRAYIASLAALPEKDISDKMSTVGVDIERTEEYLTVSSLLPTQSQVFLDATLPKIKKEDIESYFQDEVEVGIPIVTFNKRFVVDGHHRWLGLALVNPRAKISAINFESESLTPIQFLKLLQGAIVLEQGELPKTPKNTYKIDIFHASRKAIGEYIENEVDFDLKEAMRKQLDFTSVDEVVEYMQQNAFSVKYNNLPAVGSPSRELMPQTDNQEEVLNSVEGDAPVLPTADAQGE